MKTRNLLIATLLPLLLVACSKKEEEAKRLGFSTVQEMENIQAQGWHTKERYLADNPGASEASIDLNATSSASNTPSAEPTFRPKPSMQYIYDDRCKAERPNEVCASSEEAKGLCKLTDSYMPKMLALYLGSMASDKERTLFTAGSVSPFTIVWDDVEKFCVVNVTASGLYQGSSAQSVLQGRIAIFQVSVDTNVSAGFIRWQ